jgi:hypothetical protein
MRKAADLTTVLSPFAFWVLFASSLHNIFLCVAAHENGAAMDPDSTQVREFIERLVEALVSGQLDDVKVNRMYTHPECE